MQHKRSTQINKSNKDLLFTQVEGLIYQAKHIPLSNSDQTMNPTGEE